MDLVKRADRRPLRPSVRLHAAIASSMSSGCRSRSTSNTCPSDGLRCSRTCDSYCLKVPALIAPSTLRSHRPANSPNVHGGRFDRFDLGDGTVAVLLLQDPPRYGVFFRSETAFTSCAIVAGLCVERPVLHGPRPGSRGLAPRVVFPVAPSMGRVSMPRRAHPIAGRSRRRHFRSAESARWRARATIWTDDSESLQRFRRRSSASVRVRVLAFLRSKGATDQSSVRLSARHGRVSVFRSSGERSLSLFTPPMSA